MAGRSRRSRPMSTGAREEVAREHGAEIARRPIQEDEGQVHLQRLRVDRSRGWNVIAFADAAEALGKSGPCLEGMEVIRLRAVRFHPSLIASRLPWQPRQAEFAASEAAATAAVLVLRRPA